MKILLQEPDLSDSELHLCSLMFIKLVRPCDVNLNSKSKFPSEYRYIVNHASNENLEMITMMGCDFQSLTGTYSNSTMS